MEVRKRRIRAHLPSPQQEQQQRRRVKTPKDVNEGKVVEEAGEEVQRRDVKKDAKSRYSITVSARGVRSPIFPVIPRGRAFLPCVQQSHP